MVELPRPTRLLIAVVLMLSLLAVGVGNASAHVVCADSAELTTTGSGYLEQVTEHRQTALETVEFTTRGLPRLERYAYGCYG